VHPAARLLLHLVERAGALDQGVQRDHRAQVSPPPPLLPEGPPVARLLRRRRARALRPLRQVPVGGHAEL